MFELQELHSLGWAGQPPPGPDTVLAAPRSWLPWAGLSQARAVGRPGVQLPRLGPPPLPPRRSGPEGAEEGI